MVQEGRYHPFTPEVIQYYSPELIKLVKNLMEIDPTKRLSITDALLAEWLGKEIKKREPKQPSPSGYMSPKKARMMQEKEKD